MQKMKIKDNWVLCPHPKHKISEVKLFIGFADDLEIKCRSCRNIIRVQSAQATVIVPQK